MRADAARGDHRPLAARECLAEQELELARLVAAVQRAALVVAFHPQIVSPQRRAELGQAMHPRRQLRQVDARQRIVQAREGPFDR